MVKEQKFGCKKVKQKISSCIRRVLGTITPLVVTKDHKGWGEMQEKSFSAR